MYIYIYYTKMKIIPSIRKYKFVYDNMSPFNLFVCLFVCLFDWLIGFLWGLLCFVLFCFVLFFCFCLLYFCLFVFFGVFFFCVFVFFFVFAFFFFFLLNHLQTDVRIQYYNLSPENYFWKIKRSNKWNENMRKVSAFN